MSKYSIKYKGEELWNVPNPVTGLRVFLSLVLVIMYFRGYSILPLLWVFIVAASTDFLDGYLARKLNQETLFGARFDILADRILWVTFGLILIFGFPNAEYYRFYDFLFIFSREVLSGLFLIFHVLIFRKRNIIPYVRYSGKIQTVIQGILIPSMILSTEHQIFLFYKSGITLALLFGVICAFYYMFDLTLYEKYKDSKFVKYYDSFNPIAPAAYQNK